MRISASRDKTDISVFHRMKNMNVIIAYLPLLDTELITTDLTTTAMVKTIEDG